MMKKALVLLLAICICSPYAQISAHPRSQTEREQAPRVIEPVFDTTTVTTIRDGDTVTVVTISQNDPAHNIDKTLKHMFVMQAALVAVNIASAVILLIAMP
jgi:DNA replicative helicase MCM subunit Mcm2 (Cdc46/Mcm family)